MKFFTIVTTAVVALFAATAQACAPTCRMNVSNTFATHYNEVLTKTTFEPLSKNLQSDLGGSSKLETAISNAVNSIVKIFEANVVNLVFEAIFHDKPTFLTPCVYPKNVKQPIPPAQWTMTDCKNMNYLCGNPPSICHFLDIAKSKNIARIIRTLHTDSSLNGAIYKTIIAAVQKNGGSVSKAAKIIQTWKMTIVPTFCNNGTCNIWDAQIKEQLLEFP